VLSQPIFLFNSPRLDRRLDDDLITSARRADVSLPARPTHTCTCYCKFPGNQGRGQPVWSRAAATVAKRSIWDQCKDVYIDEWPTSDKRPTSHFEKFGWPYLRNGSSDPLHVWFYGGVFGDGGSNSAIFGLNKSKMAEAAILEKFQIAISP